MVDKKGQHPVAVAIEDKRLKKRSRSQEKAEVLLYTEVPMNSR